MWRLIAACGMLVIFPLLIYEAWAERDEQLAVARMGTKTEAQITGLRRESSSHSRGSHYYVDYRFKAANGRVVQGTAKLREATWSQLRPGRIAIWYDARNPNRHVSGPSLADFDWFDRYGWSVILTFVGAAWLYFEVCDLRDKRRERAAKPASPA